MSAEVLLAKLLSLYIYDTYGKVLSYGDILSLGGTLSDSDFDLIEKAIPWLQEFENCCEIIDKPVTAKGLYAICKDWSKKFGRYEELQSSSDYVKTNYIPNNPQAFKQGG